MRSSFRTKPGPWSTLVWVAILLQGLPLELLPFRLSLFQITPAYAQTSGITYHGRIIKPDGVALESASVQFKIQVRTPNSGNCLLYEETQSISMSGSAGLFAVTINDGSGTRSNLPGVPSVSFNIESLFSNRRNFSGLSDCASGDGSYSPSSTDGRRLQVYFKDASMSAWEPMPVQTLSAVPYAIDANQVAGFTSKSLLRVQDGDGTLGDIAPITNAQITELMAVINGTSTTYSKANQLNGFNVPSMSSGQALRWTGSSWQAYSAIGSGEETDPSVRAFAKAALPTCTTGNVLTSTDGLALTCTPASAGGVGSLSATAPLMTTGSSAVTISMASGSSAGQALRWSGSSWTAAVLSASDISGLGTSATRNVGTATGTVAAGDDARFTDSRPPTGAAGGDLGGTYPNPSVVRLQSHPVSATTLSSADIGKMYRWTGTELAPSFIGIDDMRTETTGASQFSANCLSSQTLVWSSVTDAFTCTTIAITSSQVSGLAGSATTDTTNASNITSGTLSAARLPASITDAAWTTGSSSSIYRASGNVGIGTTNPTTPLSVGPVSTALSSLANNTAVTVSGVSASTLMIEGTNPSGAVSGSHVNLYSNDGAEMASGDRLGGIIVGGSSSSASLRNTASISAFAEQAWVDGSAYGTNLTFSTTNLNATSRTEKMRISANGNVGIGTTAPSHNLDIAGTNPGLRVSHIGGASAWIQPSATTVDMGTSTNHPLRLVTNNVERVRVDSVGNVGIGTTAPSSKLEVADGMIRTSGTAAYGLQLYRSGSLIGSVTSASNMLSFHDAAGNGTQFLNSSAAANMTISNAGSVGIGTTNPTASLHVVTSGTTALQVGRTNNTTQGATITHLPGSATSPSNVQWVTGLHPGSNDYRMSYWDGSASTVALDVGNTGNVGIGITSPGAVLHLKAGTAAANTAPLKFTSGTSLTTAETGAMEYDGTHLYFTPTGTTRRTIAYVDQLGTATSVGAGAGTAGAPSISFSGDPDTGVFSSGANSIGLTAGGVNQFNVSSSGMVSTTSGGGLVTSAAGSEAAPTFSFAGDADTGWFSPSANTLAGSTGGTERLRIDSTGRVGIGTTSPAGKLHISGTGVGSGSDPTYRGHLIIESSEFNNASNGLEFKASAAGAGHGFRFATIYDGASADDLRIQSRQNSATWVDRMTITPTGNVGIGTTSPGSLLEVTSGTPGADTYTVVSKDTTFNRKIGLFWKSGGAAGGVRSDANLHLTAGANLFLETAATGAAYAPFKFGVGSSGALGLPGGATGNALAINGGMIITNGSPVWHQTAPPAGGAIIEGNVGIGTTAPSWPLHVYKNNSGSNTRLAVENPATATTSSADLVAATGTTNAYSSVLQMDGATPYTQIISGPANTGGMYLDQQAAAPMIFRTNGSVERMRIDSAGKVGIGTTMPGEKLSVVGSTDTFVSIDPGGTSRAAQFKTSRGGTGSFIGPSSGNTFDFWTYENIPIRIGSNNTSRMYVDTSGNVGIGAISPNYKLHVKDSGALSDVRSEANDYAKFSLRANNGGVDQKAWQMYAQASGNKFLLTSINDAENSAQVAMEVNRGTGEAISTVNFPNGNVGIGTTSPDRPLVIEGTAPTLGLYHSGGKGLALGASASEASIDSIGATDLRLNTNNVERMRILSSGNVGIGTTSPDSSLVVFNGSTTGKYTTGGWTHSSDLRLKSEIKPLENSLERIIQLEGVQYKFKSDPKQELQVGFIAQQVEPIFPEVVQTDKDGFKSMVYANLVAPLVEAVKSLFHRVVRAEADLASLRDETVQKADQASMELHVKRLEEKNEKLKQENTEMKARLDRIEKLLESK